MNPKYDEVEGIKCFPSFSDLPEVVDLAVLAIGNVRLETQLKEAIKLGVGSAVLFESAILEGEAAPTLMDRIITLESNSTHYHKV